MVQKCDSLALILRHLRDCIYMYVCCEENSWNSEYTLNGSILAVMEFSGDVTARVLFSLYGSVTSKGLPSRKLEVSPEYQ